MIILVEDCKLNRKIMEKKLKEFTNEPIISFTNGKDAISFIEKNHNDITLLILDGHIPNTLLNDIEMNGPNIAAEALKIDKNIPIATWTDAQEMTERFKKLFALHSKSFYTLPKPISSQDLEVVMKQVVTKRSYDADDETEMSPFL